MSQDGKINDETRFSTQFSMMESVPKFSGDDLTYSSLKWSQDLEDNAEVFNWSPQQKLIIARRSLTGTAELWLRTEKTFKTYDELKGAIIKEFPEAVNSKQMHEIMSARKKKNNETCYQYMLIMKELGKRAKMPDYVSIQYIIEGIQDYEANKLMLYGITTYTALKEKLALYETYKQNSRRHQIPKLAQTTKTKPEIKRTSRCYNCGSTEHLANTCKNGLKCFRCNNYGHVGSECKAEKSSHYSSRHFASSSTGSAGVGTKLQRSAMFAQCPAEGATDVHRSEVVSWRSKPQTSTSNDTDVINQEVQVSNQRSDQSVLSVNKRCNSSLNKSVKSAKIGVFSVDCLIDTGSDINIITYDLFSKLDIKYYEAEEMTLTGLGSCKVYSIGKFHTDVIIDAHCYVICFYIVPNGVIPYQVILGQPFLSNTTLVINKGTVEIRPESYDCSYLMCLPSSIDCDTEKSEVQEFIDNYDPVKIKEAPIKMKIVLKDDVPVSQRPRRLALKEEEVVKQQIDEWLSKGIIRPSYSEYSSPLVLVKKKDGSTRVCVDYRKINQKMVKDEYPLPVIDDHIDKLCKARVFSTLDLKNGL